MIVLKLDFNTLSISFPLVPVCPHAGGVGLCELVQHLILFDYICVSASLHNRCEKHLLITKRLFMFFALCGESTVISFTSCSPGCVNTWTTFMSTSQVLW